jgi:hypothetical protein
MRSASPPRYSLTSGTHARKQKDVPAPPKPRPRETRPVREARRAVTADLGAFESRAEKGCADATATPDRRKRVPPRKGGVRLRSGSPVPQLRSRGGPLGDNGRQGEAASRSRPREGDSSSLAWWFARARLGRQDSIVCSKRCPTRCVAMPFAQIAQCVCHEAR